MPPHATAPPRSRRRRRRDGRRPPGRPGKGGYGPGADDVAATVRAVVEAGAVGVDLEDSLAPGGPLHDAPAQAVRLSAARTAAEEAGLPGLWPTPRRAPTACSGPVSWTWTRWPNRFAAVRCRSTRWPDRAHRP
ncbi:isocitrate lyase/phosphoenolpyruvate mutase family protein [Streptomyces sp. tea 10]|nr:isocitrate lyase/phosphoenolpyruvate mutase family protein [Streptomyces sp. tea 10]